MDDLLYATVCKPFKHASFVYILKRVVDYLNQYGMVSKIIVFSFRSTFECVCHEIMFFIEAIGHWTKRKFFIETIFSNLLTIQPMYEFRIAKIRNSRNSNSSSEAIIYLLILRRKSNFSSEVNLKLEHIFRRKNNAIIK